MSDTPEQAADAPTPAAEPTGGDSTTNPPAAGRRPRRKKKAEPDPFANDWRVTKCGQCGAHRYLGHRCPGCGSRDD